MINYRFPKGAALVFGGSGVLGSGIVELLSKNGTDIAFTYLNNSKSAEELTEIVEANGRQVFSKSVNLLELSGVKEFSNEAKDKFERIHSVIDATGPFINIAPILDSDPEDVYKTLDTDINGFYHILKSTIPILKEGGGGSITALTAAAVHRYINTAGLSSIPKTVVQYLCTAIAREEGVHGIRANCVAVGQIDLLSDKQKEEIDSSGDVANQFLQLIPLGRPGKPDELFNAVAFLASENSGYISGQSLAVDGGYSA
tara:strand:+ start:204 stop:974 length:771 start_codon:yes stop_codon:yes gene_type:complete